MLPKLVIGAILIGILVALFSGVYFLVKDPSTRDHRRTMRALTWRVILQLALILFLVLAYFRGWIHPHSVYERPAASAPQ